MLKLNLMPDDEHVALLNRQKQFARELAAKLDKKPLAAVDLGNGDTLTAIEKLFAAAILRGWAATPSKPPKRGRGRPPKFPDGEAALLVEAYATKLKSRREAVERVAGHYGVDKDTVRDAVRKCRAEAKATLDMPGVTAHVKKLPPRIRRGK